MEPDKKLVEFQIPPNNNIPAVEPSTSTSVIKEDIQYKWRFESTVVAYLDLVLASLVVALIVPCTVGLTCVAVGTDLLKWNETIYEKWPRVEEKNWSVFLGILFAFLYIGWIVSFVDIWAGNNLRIATNLSREPEKALPRALIWMRVNLAIFAISLFSLILGYSSWTVWIVLGFRLARIAVVHMHIRELRVNSGQTLTRQKYDPTKQKVTITISTA